MTGFMCGCFDENDGFSSTHASRPALAYYTRLDYDTLRFTVLCKTLCYLFLVMLLRFYLNPDYFAVQSV